jgi:hypothetical protein
MARTNSARRLNTLRMVLAAICANQRHLCAVVVLVGAAMPAIVSAADACEAPVLLHEWPEIGLGRPQDLKWKAVEGASAYRVRAQWRVPEGEILKTFENQVAESRIEVPASPEPGRPLKLIVELQALCGAASVSPVQSIWQAQFDPAVACAPVKGLRREAARSRLRWEGTPNERFFVEGLDPGDGRVLESREVAGTELAWSKEANVSVIRATRLCGANQRSVPSYLMLR